MIDSFASCRTLFHIWPVCDISHRFLTFNLWMLADLCPALSDFSLSQSPLMSGCLWACGDGAVNPCLLGTVNGFALEVLSGTIIILLCKWRAGYYFISEAEYLQPEISMQIIPVSVLAAAPNVGGAFGPIWSGAARHGLIKALGPSVPHNGLRWAPRNANGLWKMFAA